MVANGTPGPPDVAALALADAVLEIERHVARAGWDAPLRVFALVSTRRALDAEPGLAEQLTPEVLAAAQSNPHHLTSIEQEGLPAAADLESLLAGISWPEAVDGAAVVVERIILPPSAQEDMPDAPDDALDYLMAHPERQDVRVAVGVLRNGPAWCAVRSRSDDDDAAVGGGPDVIPGLVAAVRATLD